MSEFGAGLWIKFQVKRNAKNKAEIEHASKDMLLRLGIIAETDFEAFEVVTSSYAVNQTLAERMRA